MNEHVHAKSRGRAAGRPPLLWSLAGFGPMTRVSASFGEVPAQALRERDSVRTQEGSLKPIVWVDRIRLDAAYLERVPDAHPVLIRAGSLGSGLPKADVVVSPDQLVGLGRHAHDLKFIKAREMCGRPGVLRKPEEIMTYTLFDCGETVCVRIEGLWARVDPRR